MIVKTLDDVLGTEAEVKGGHWVSRRLLLKRDGMGFSLHDTVVYAGGVSELCYTNHLEAVYIIEGEGELEDVATGKIYQMSPGFLYALDQHDKHILRAATDVRCICVYNPPLAGAEKHDEDGSFPLVED